MSIIFLSILPLSEKPWTLHNYRARHKTINVFQRQLFEVSSHTRKKNSKIHVHHLQNRQRFPFCFSLFVALFKLIQLLKVKKRLGKCQTEISKYKNFLVFLIFNAKSYQKMGKQSRKRAGNWHNKCPGKGPKAGKQKWAQMQSNLGENSVASGIKLL